MSRDQASGLRDAGRPRPVERRERDRWDPRVAVLSGKGGVGKTNLVANLAVAAAGLRRKVMVVDGDLGLANMDVLLGLVPPRTVEDVLAGDCTLHDALVEGPRRVQFLPAASGRTGLAALGGRRLERLVGLLCDAARDFDLVLIDAGAGIGPSVVGLAASCSRALVVTTPEPTSLADAYATLKVLRRDAPGLPVEIVVNWAASEREARDTHSRLDRMAQRFLGASIPFRGFLPRDPRLVEAVARQRAVVELFPTAAWSRRLVALAQGLLREQARDRLAPRRPPLAGESNRGDTSCIRN